MRRVYLSALLHLAETEAQITNNMWNNTQSHKEWLTGLHSLLLRVSLWDHTGFKQPPGSSKQPLRPLQDNEVGVGADQIYVCCCLLLSRMHWCAVTRSEGFSIYVLEGDSVSKKLCKDRIRKSKLFFCSIPSGFWLGHLNTSCLSWNVTNKLSSA